MLGLLIKQVVRTSILCQFWLFGYC